MRSSTTSPPASASGCSCCCGPGCRATRGCRRRGGRRCCASGATVRSRCCARASRHCGKPRSRSPTCCPAAGRRSVIPGPPGTRQDAPAPRLEPIDVGDGLELECDVCVVGSGAGGGVAAAVLAHAGLDVVVLEAGGYWSERDFDGAERAGLRRLYRGGGAAATDDQGVALIAGACLGGGTVVNYTTSFRTPDDVLAEWEGLGFPSAELGPSLDAVCQRLGVNTDHNRPSRRDETMARGLESLGWHVEAMPRDVLGCEQGVVCGSCGYGCPLGAKQSTLRTWLEDAAGAGARIVVGARARRVLVEGGRAAGVDAGQVQVRSRAVVAAAGAIETPALLLRSGLRTRTSVAGYGSTRQPRSSGSSRRRSGRGRGRCRRSTRISSASSTAATASSSRRCRCTRRCCRRRCPGRVRRRTRG